MAEHHSKPLSVMFFAEPFPVRSRPLDISWIFHRWKITADGLGRRGHQPTFVASDAVLQTHSDFPWKAYTPATMAVPVPCYRTDDDCDEAWGDLLRDPYAQPWRSFIARVLDAARPDVILTWTENAPLLAEAKARKILLVHTELGPVRSPHCHFCYFDPLALGFNSDTAVQEVWPHFRDQPLTPEQAWQIDTLLRDYIARPPESQAVRESMSPNDKPLIAYFLQVRRDAKCMKGSMPGGVPATLALLKKAVDPAKFLLVVKPHPGDPEAAQVVTDHGFILAPSHLPTSVLTCASDVTLTCNSAVGFEALCQGKIVYTLSESSYAGRGITRDFAKNPDALESALAQETFVLNAEELFLRQRFLHFMFFRYLIPERMFWDADAMALRLEHWKDQFNSGAPIKSLYQQDNGMSVLHELSASARISEIAAHSASRIFELESRASARLSALEKLEGEIGSLTHQLAEAHRNLKTVTAQLKHAQTGLNLLQNSAAQRAIGKIRSVPGLQSFYVGTKQMMGSLRKGKTRSIDL